MEGWLFFFFFFEGQAREQKKGPRLPCPQCVSNKAWRHPAAVFYYLDTKGPLPGCERKGSGRGVEVVEGCVFVLVSVLGGGRCREK